MYLNKRRKNMIFIVKLVIIILLKETYGYISQNIETILLPELKWTRAEKMSLTLKVFGKQIYLNLRLNRKNKQILSSIFDTWKSDNAKDTKILSQLYISNPYYYFHKDHISTAIIKFYQENEWEGIVILKDETLEIRPLWDDFEYLSLIDNHCFKEKNNISLSKLLVRKHLIKRSLQLFPESSFRNQDIFKQKRRRKRNTQKTLNMELAVFFDEAAYRTFMPFLDNDIEKLHDMILAYVNRIQAIYHHPTLGVSIDISLVAHEIGHV